MNRTDIILNRIKKRRMTKRTETAAFKTGDKVRIRRHIHKSDIPKLQPAYVDFIRKARGKTFVIAEIDSYGFYRLDGSDWWFCEQDLERISA